MPESYKIVDLPLDEAFLFHSEFKAAFPDAPPLGFRFESMDSVAFVDNEIWFLFLKADYHNWPKSKDKRREYLIKLVQSYKRFKEGS